MDNFKIKTIGHDKKTLLLHQLLTGEDDIKITVVDNNPVTVDCVGLYNAMTRSTARYLPVIGLEVHPLRCTTGEGEIIYVRIWDIDSNSPQFGDGIPATVEVTEDDTISSLKIKIQDTISQATGKSGIKI